MAKKNEDLQQKTLSEEISKSKKENKDGKPKKKLSRKLLGMLFFVLIVAAAGLICYYVAVRHSAKLAKVPLMQNYLAKRAVKEANLSAEAQLMAKEGNLKIKERELDKRSKSLDERKAFLDKKEADLKKMASAGEFQSANSLNNKNNAEKPAPENKIIRIYGKMDAQKAAKILTKMDEKTAVNILMALKPDQAGEIMENMPQNKAAGISKIFMRGNSK